MEGDVLSRRSSGREDAAVLCGAFRFRRDQQYVLSDAGGEDAREVVRRSAGSIHIRAEGAAAHHASEKTRRYGGRCPPLLRSRRGDEGKTRAGALSVAAVSSKRRGAIARLRGDAAEAAAACRIRISSRVVVRR